MDVGCNAMERTVQWFMTDDVCLSFTATEDRWLQIDTEFEAEIFLQIPQGYGEW